MQQTRSVSEFSLPSELTRLYPNVFSNPGGGGCTARAKSLACDILSWHNSGRIHLWNMHPSGQHDHAYALNNIRDMCNGHQASRSQ